MTDQPTPLPDQPPPLHEQVRTLEADLAMCREQLAQETERAEKAEKMATSPGSPLVQQADTYRRILAHGAIYTHTCISPGRVSMSDQIIARLDELAVAESERDEWRDRALQSADEELVRQVGEVCRTTLSNVLGYLGITHFDRTDWAAVARDALQAAGLLKGGGDDADHLEAEQQQADLCSDTEPDSRVQCQEPKGHPGDHCYEDDYGNGIAWPQDALDADEELIEKAAQTLSDGCDRGCMSLSWDRLPESVREQWRHHARNLLNAGLLQGGDEK